MEIIKVTRGHRAWPRFNRKLALLRRDTRFSLSLPLPQDTARRPPGRRDTAGPQREQEVPASRTVRKCTAAPEDTHRGTCWGASARHPPPPCRISGWGCTAAFRQQGPPPPTCQGPELPHHRPHTHQRAPKFQRERDSHKQGARACPPRAAHLGVNPGSAAAPGGASTAVRTAQATRPHAWPQAPFCAAHTRRPSPPHHLVFAPLLPCRPRACGHCSRPPGVRT